MRVCTVLCACLILLVHSPLEAQQRWVLPAENVPAVQKALSLSGSISPGVTITGTDLRIEDSTLEVCYRGVSPSPFCLTLTHADNASNGAEALGGGFVLHPPLPQTSPAAQALLARIRENLKRLSPQDIWYRTKAENTRVPDEVRSYQERMFRLIWGLLKHGETELALEALDLSDQLIPEPFRLELLRLQALTYAGKFDEARRLLQQIELPHEQTRLREEARLLLLEGKVSEGLSRLQAANLDPENEEDYCLAEQVADFLERQGKERLARSIRREALTLFPDCGALWWSAARHLIDEGRAQDVLSMTEERLKSHPDQVSVITARMAATRRLKMYAEAEALLIRLYELTQDPRWIYFHSTVVSQNEANLKRLDVYRQRMLEHPESLLHRHAVGVLSYYAGEYETSIAINDALRPLLPEDQRVLIYGAMSRYELGDWEGARAWLEDLDRLIERMGPDFQVDPDVYYCKAILWHRKDPRKALSELDRYLTYPFIPDASARKHVRALEYRERIVQGKGIAEWVPSSERIDFTWTEVANAAGGLALMLGLVFGLLWMRRRRG